MKYFVSLFIFILISIVLMSENASADSKKRNISPTLALKNYRELFGALQTATRVDPSVSEIANYYTQVMAQLPRSGTLVEFNSQSLIASVGLSSVFCKRLIYQDSSLNVPKSGLNKGIDFMKPVSQVTDTKITDLVKNYSNAFLQRDATASEQTTLVDLFKSQGSSDATPNGTKKAVLAVCTSIASSFEFLSN